MCSLWPQLLAHRSGSRQHGRCSLARIDVVGQHILTGVMPSLKPGWQPHCEQADAATSNAAPEVPKKESMGQMQQRHKRVRLPRASLKQVLQHASRMQADSGV
jgi:hypothetical protein